MSILVFQSFMTCWCVGFISIVFFLWWLFFLRADLKVFSSASFISVSLNVSVYPEAFTSQRETGSNIRGRERPCGSLTTPGSQPWFKVCVSVSVVKIASLSHSTKPYHVPWHTCVSPAVMFHIGCCHHVTVCVILCHTNGEYHDIVAFAAYHRGKKGLYFK